MSDLFDNPMGLCGFEFVEFAAPSQALNVLEPVFAMLGFTKVALHRSKDVALYRQGEINFIVNHEPGSAAAFFAAEHGPCACGMAFRVKDAPFAYARALQLGAQALELHAGPMELHLPAIKGIGGSALFLIDRFREGQSIYENDFRFIDGVPRHPVGYGLTKIDHLTHNVYRGRMDYWLHFYERLFNFRQLRYFDIKGEYTSLISRALAAPDGKIRIPLNEEAAGSGGQIDEFLLKFKGEGIQHIALATNDLISSVDALRQAGVPLMKAPPERYYAQLEARLPDHGESVGHLQARGILLDGSQGGNDDGHDKRHAQKKPRLLLQIFSEALLGPVFFEFIERKGDQGFGEGNFQALFESIERDQVRRGVIAAS